MTAIIFCGSIGSGKTSVSKLVAEALDAPRVSFGGYLRQVASDRSLDASDREVLQDLGLEFIGQPTSFCEAVLAQVEGWQDAPSLVIDGVRHVIALDSLREILRPRPLFVVYLEPPQDVLDARREDRGDRFNAANHPVEQDVSRLNAFADIAFRDDQDVKTAAAEILVRLRA